MKAFENALSAKLNKSLQGTFYYAGTIRQSPAKIKELLPPPTAPSAKPEDKPTTPAPTTSPISNFKAYLAKNKMFTGPINDEPTQEFISTIKRLEDMIAAAVQKLTSKKPNTANLIWNNNQLATTPEDVDKALAILAKQLKARPIAKSGQATVENIENSGPPPYDFLVHDFETGNPDESQQIGRRFPEIPQNMMADKPAKNLANHIPEMAIEDQKLRNVYSEYLKRHGYVPGETMGDWEKARDEYVNATGANVNDLFGDSKRASDIKHIIDNRLEEIIDLPQNVKDDMFLLVQHLDDVEYQQKYLDKIRDHDSQRNIQYLEDRIAVNSGNNQVHGTQYSEQNLSTYANLIPTEEEQYSLEKEIMAEINGLYNIVELCKKACTSREVAEKAGTPESNELYILKRVKNILKIHIPDFQNLRLYTKNFFNNKNLSSSELLLILLEIKRLTAEFEYLKKYWIENSPENKKKSQEEGFENNRRNNEKNIMKKYEFFQSCLNDQYTEVVDVDFPLMIINDEEFGVKFKEPLYTYYDVNQNFVLNKKYSEIRKYVPHILSTDELFTKQFIIKLMRGINVEVILSAYEAFKKLSPNAMRAVSINDLIFFAEKTDINEMCSFFNEFYDLNHASLDSCNKIANLYLRIKNPNIIEDIKKYFPDVNSQSEFIIIMTLIADGSNIDYIAKKHFGSDIYETNNRIYEQKEIERNKKKYEAFAAPLIAHNINNKIIQRLYKKILDHYDYYDTPNERLILLIVLFFKLLNKDVNYVDKFIIFLNNLGNISDFSLSDRGLNKLLKKIILGNIKINKHNPEEHLTSLINRHFYFEKIKHNNNDDDDDDGSDNNMGTVSNNMYRKFMNGKFDINNALTKFMLEIILSKKEPKKFEPRIFEIYNKIVQSFKDGRPYRDQEGLYLVHSAIEYQKQLKVIKQYEGRRKKKVEKLAVLNFTTSDGSVFKVLEDGSLKHFSIGALTDCCQRIGGAGENAAIDSYINPLAGVLVLYKNGRVLAQSYFHYVPNDNGFILDNVEVNNNNIKNADVDINVHYKEFAEHIKNSGSKYLKCGLAYNNLDEKQFKLSKMKTDPRYFATEERYSDFSHEKHLGLF